MKKTLTIVITGLLIATVAIASVILFILLPSKSDASVENDVYIYDTGNDFLTNLRDGSHYVKAGIIIEVSKKEALKTLETNNHIVRDRIIENLGNIQEDHIKDEKFKDDLKALLKDDLQDVLKTDKIKGIYFNEFIIQ